MLLDRLLSACRYDAHRCSEDLLAGLIRNRHQLGPLGEELIRLLWEAGVRPTPLPRPLPSACPPRAIE